MAAMNQADKETPLVAEAFVGLERLDSWNSSGVRLLLVGLKY